MSGRNPNRENNMLESGKKRLLVTGTSPYWNELVAEWLRSKGLECDRLDGRPHRSVLRWLLTGRWKRQDLFYLICPNGNWLVMGLLCILKKPCLLHWIGSDVLSFTEGKSSSGWRHALFCRFLRRRGDIVHLADSPELAEELKQAGIASTVIRLIPDKVKADTMNLPTLPKVLSYWSNDRKDFYNGDTVFQLAAEFPDTPFMILGATGKNISVPSNVQFLGQRDDIENIYRDVSVLIRIPKHDSLGMMVVEMLARGRYVLYNKSFPHCYLVHTFDQIRQALQDALRKTEPNREGAEYVRDHFSPKQEAEKLAKICRTILKQNNKEDPV